ncbi:uncharacterized protein LOC108743474 isoform X2 [Agrilus planipennis]|uniref:Uncharacterized protein LOC108743474 isoform X2 n=1 Tax=Agrilus planipennis TaxID=224129 RepID=A0A1W4XEI7_AGRPL|nr:uncharacterized protein LOC108743474 isoform X2 [Agrilus planipennis]
MSCHYGSPKPMRRLDINDGQIKNWYQHCNCCPYGYHIDLDFVRYCENISQGIHRTESFKRRKDRRRQRQSMEVLLGIEPQNLFKLESDTPIREERQLFTDESFRKNAELISDALDEVVSDFEKTWNRSHKVLTNLPDVTAVNDTIYHAPSISSISSNSGSFMVLPTASEDAASNHDYDMFNIDSVGLNPAALQNIRDQVAISLERTKELEERVKLIPKLQLELHNLKRENVNLLSKLSQEESKNNSKFNNTNVKSMSSLNATKLETINQNGILSMSPPRKDFSVMCSVLTRNIGVGHYHPNTKSVSTNTYDEERSTDKWLDKKWEFLENSYQKAASAISKATQTPIKVTKDIFNQTSYILKENRNTQTVNVISVRNYGVSAVIPSSEIGVTAAVLCQDTGVSEDTITDIICPKCNCSKSSIAVGPDSVADGQLPISLSLISSRSKSFNLGEERLNLQQKQRTVACQYEADVSHKSCQCLVQTSSKACQHQINTTEKFVQYKNDEAGIFSIHIGCNTEIPMEVKKKSVACNTPNKEVKTKEAASNTIINELQTKDAACNTGDVEIPGKKEYLRMNEKEKEKEEIKKEDVGALSRIPRLQTDVRKFRRQDTYTKISEPIKGPKRATPSKEMQAALKVLNDSLQKGLTKNSKNQLKNAINIIEQEWFNVSSLDGANPMEVEGYLDYFEEISSELLHYIVNMSDASGNTAMHYSVSHGNFDIVSILLDSKVCDINKPNKAGYTSVMLVSLAELQSSTHMEVVRRLFQLADVNIKAQQHGQTALMLAVSHGRLDMVNMLLDAGADINIQDEDGSTALMCAAEHGHVDIVKLFLSHSDCDSSITDVDGSTALKIAMEAGHRHIGVLLYAHERNVEAAHSGKLRKSKSASLSPRTQSSPLLPRKPFRAVTEFKSNKH